MQTLTVDVTIRAKFDVDNNVDLEEIKKNIKQHINDGNYMVRFTKIKYVEANND